MTYRTTSDWLSELDTRTVEAYQGPFPEHAKQREIMRLLDDMSVAKPYASGWETLRLNEFISEYVEGQTLQTASYITEHQNGIILDQLRSIQNYNLSQE